MVDGEAGGAGQGGAREPAGARGPTLSVGVCGGDRPRKPRLEWKPVPAIRERRRQRAAAEPTRARTPSIMRPIPS